MRGKLRKLFKVLFPNKKVLILGLGLILFLSLAPSSTAQASVFGDILNIIKNLPVTIIVLAIVIPLFITTLVLGSVVTIFNTLMVAFIHGTMSVGVTPANQGFVEIGWSVSRDLMNLVFVLIIVFIGLATILRLETYQMKKTLPLFIAIAILINFSGVLVGFVVDVSNLTTDFFISKATSFGALGGVAKDISEQIMDMAKAPGATVFVEAVSLITQTIVSLIYFLFVVIIIFMIMLIFFARMIALWVLAILAPLAFAAYILPATRSWWNRWWSQLIQWSLVGLPIGFFLYLSSILLQKLSVPDDSPFSGWPGFGDLFVATLGNFVVLALLGVGIMLSMELAPAAAKGIVKMGGKVGAIGGLSAGSAAWRRLNKDNRIGGWGTKIRKRGAEDPEKWEGRFAWAANKIGMPKLARFGQRWAGRGIQRGAGELSKRVRDRDARKANEAEKRATNRFSGDNMLEMNEAGAKKDWATYCGLMKGTSENADNNDLQYAIEDGTLENQHIAPALMWARKNLEPSMYRQFLKGHLGPMLTDPRSLGFNADVNEKGEYEGNDEDVKFLTSMKREIPIKMKAEDQRGNKVAPYNLDPYAFERDENGEIRKDENGNNIPDERKRKMARAYLRTIIEIRDAELYPSTAIRPEKNIRQNILHWTYEDNEEGLGVERLIDMGAEGVLNYGKSPGALREGINIAPTLNEIKLRGEERRNRSSTTEDLNRRVADLQIMLDDPDFTPNEKRRYKQRQAMLKKELEIRNETTNPTDWLKDQVKEMENEKATVTVEMKAKWTAEEYKTARQNEPLLRSYKRELVRRGAVMPDEQEGIVESLEERIGKYINPKRFPTKKMYKGKMSAEDLENAILTLEKDLSDGEKLYEETLLSKGIPEKTKDKVRKARAEIEKVKISLQSQRALQSTSSKTKKEYLRVVKGSLDRYREMYKNELKLSDKEIEDKLRKDFGEKIMKALEEEMGGN